MKHFWKALRKFLECLFANFLVNSFANSFSEFPQYVSQEFFRHSLRKFLQYYFLISNVFFLKFIYPQFKLLKQFVIKLPKQLPIFRILADVIFQYVARKPPNNLSAEFLTVLWKVFQRNKPKNAGNFEDNCSINFQGNCRKFYKGVFKQICKKTIEGIRKEYIEFPITIA